MKTVLLVLLALSVVPAIAQNRSVNPVMGRVALPQGTAVLQIEKGTFSGGGNRSCATLSLQNSGNAPLVVESFVWEMNAGYEFSSPPSLPLTIQPGEERELEVCITAPSTSLPPDILSVVSNTRKSIAWGLLVDISRSLALNELSCGDSNITRLEGERKILRRVVDSMMIQVRELGIEDYTGMIEFSGDRTPTAPFKLIPYLSPSYPFVPFSDKARAGMHRKIDSLEEYGRTMTGYALFAIIDSLSRSPLQTRNVVLVTDGQTDDLNEYPVSAIIQHAVQEHVSIFAINLDEFSFPEARTYLDSITTMTGGIVLQAYSCDDIDRIIPPLAKAIAAGTLLQEPFPEGATLAVPDGNAEGLTFSVESVMVGRVRDQIRVEIQSNGREEFLLSLYNLKGERLAEGAWERVESRGRRSLTVSTPYLAAGNYLLVLKTREGGMSSTKILVE